ncbi:hypothetical protein F2Q69_00000401 [Brassica cretica]|uniref:NPH3 domain-containing protein n=1 Tax=Brassica cretica TaxID=69181 RepID=A0A8S9P7L4_BRACR|nr:hypothetical protein F2Q69_00000401 [Brassica cretica]
MMQLSFLRQDYCSSACKIVLGHNINCIVVQHRVVALANSFEKKDRSCVSKSQIRNDLSIQVDDIIFQAHKVVYLHQERHASLEDANVCDILIPNFRNEDKGASSLEVYNIDVVHRILEYHLMHEQQQQQK